MLLIQTYLYVLYKNYFVLGTIESDKKEYAKAVVELAMSSIGKSTLPKEIKDKLNNRSYDVEQIPRTK